MRPDRGPRRLSTSGRISSSYSRISGIGGSPTSFGPKQIRTWPLPGDTVLPMVSGLVDAPVLKAVFTAERCDQPTWEESPAEFSDGNLQLHGRTHLCMAP